MINVNGVIEIFSPVYKSLNDFLNFSISVISASSCCVTCGISLQDFSKWGAAIFLILGIGFVSISPNSEWSYCCNDAVCFF